MKEAAAYCRVACAKQSDPSAEVQLQEQRIRRYADARGLVICETYLDATWHRVISAHRMRRA
jgi:hypothetical protein